jgi:hypothetical protein
MPRSIPSLFAFWPLLPYHLVFVSSSGARAKEERRFGHLQSHHRVNESITESDDSIAHAHRDRPSAAPDATQTSEPAPLLKDILLTPVFAV